MSGSEQAAEDRTEAPTQRRLQQAREQGQLPVSRDVATLASLGGGAVGAVALAPALIRRLAEQSGALLGQADRVRLMDGTILGSQVCHMLFSAMQVVGAVAIPAAVCSIACTVVQTQFYIGGAPIRFQASRISPGAGFSRLVSQRHLLDFLKSCGRLAVLSMLLWSVLGHTPVKAIGVISTDVAWLLPVARQLTEDFARPLLIALFCFAAIDVLLTQFQHAKSLRMTRQQIRLEFRDSEGDPYMKAKLKRIRDMRSRKRMMAKVKSAAVVITNPTHYAVALFYNNTGTPRGVAKGADFLAARIREEAETHRIPIVANPPLARALYQVELDQEIPAEHFRAVAEVIAYVWKLKGRRPAPGGRP